MTLHEAVQFLIDGGYMVIRNGKYAVTAKFNKEIIGKETGLVVLANNVLAVKEEMLPDKVIKWDQLYMQFIAEAQVPARLTNNKGEIYDVNKYSDVGMKAFRRALEVDKVNYQVLVKSTMLYYKSSNKFKFAITRYMQDGAWKTDYEELLASAEAGKVDELVKDKTQTNEWSRYKLG